ncbi:MAG: TlpA family protein disulfide reductase [Candidatus Brocadiae bacterium]|nr:TlpA family protein disulfide reductase [Candidatus Brocadiia bacterium]
MQRARLIGVLMAAMALMLGVHSPVVESDESAPAAAVFEDDPAAHALYDQMLETMREAETLHYRSDYSWRREDMPLGSATYEVWLKKPNHVRIEARCEGQLKGVLVGDGQSFWIFWPAGRPRYGWEKDGKYAEEYERTHLISYMKQASPAGHHSLAHLTGKLGAGMSMTIINPSVFHGCTDSMEPHLDGVRSIGTETVGDEACDVVEASFMKRQRSRYFRLSRSDHLPRKLEEVVRVGGGDIITRETWWDVVLNDPLAADRFSWEEPEGWTEFRFPEIEEGLLVPGTEAPDFDLPTADGSRIRLSDYRGKVVWITVWRVGCPPCREEMPHLEELHRQHKDKGLLVIGINPGDKKKIALEFLAEHSVTFPNVLDCWEEARTGFFEQYETMKGRSAVPLNYLIDREGKVAAAWYGYSEDDTSAAETLKRLGIE